MTITSTQKSNEKALLKFYQDSANRLKKMIFQASLRGNETEYLRGLQAEAEKEIVYLEAKFAKYAKDASVYAYSNGVDKQEQAYVQLKIPFEPTNLTSYASFGGVHKEAVKILVENTYKPLNKITTLIGRDVQNFLKRDNFKSSQEALKALGKFVDNKTLREVGLSNVKGIVFGDTAWNKAMRDMTKELASKDIFKIPYYSKDGSVKCYVEAKKYAEMVARTTSAEAFREGSKNSILETFEGNDLVEITGPLDDKTREVCAEALGKIYSLEGITEGYPLIEEYESNGGFGVNCRHDIGISSKVIEEYEKNNIDY